MKEIFRNIGVLALACFSFLLTDETVRVVKEADKLMIEIKSVASEYQVDAIDAKINGDYITPGISGLEIDIDKSYQNMKRIGYFHENMLVYKNIKPKITIENNKDKIINHGAKQAISLIFINPENLDQILSILDNNQVSAAFFVDNTYYKNNFESLELSEIYNNDIGVYGDYKELKKEIGSSNYYCYSNLKDSCYRDNKYTIEETFKVSDLTGLKKDLKKGSIILVENSEYLDIYIKYILSRGYEITRLSNFIDE